MSRQSQSQESRHSVPAYIVTFSDMVTLLLTFFVLLISLAQMQDVELFDKGQDAFIKRINSTGLGMLFGKKMSPDFVTAKQMYYISNPDGRFVRTIDAKEEGIRRVFQAIARSMTTMPSQIVAPKSDFLVTNITFSPGEWQLNEAAKKFLTKFATDLQHGSDSEEIKLYVLGLAQDEHNEKEQWILSARRAQAVADFLNDVLPAQRPHGVFSWGAGPGGVWVDENSPVSRQSQILIAFLSKND